LDEIDRQWAKVPARQDGLDLISSLHRSLAEDGGEYIDDRTWSDLNLDAVFRSINGSQSTIGRQVLYHRLRSAMAPAALPAFEALVARMTTDVERRRAAQLTLGHLHDRAGYDLWWFTQPGAIERRSWWMAFPAVAIINLVCLAISPIWPAALLVPIYGSVLTLAIRAVAARQTNWLVGSLRELSPLIRAARKLRDLNAPDLDAILGTLNRDLEALPGLDSWAGLASRDRYADGGLVGYVMELINHVFLLDLNALYFCSRRLEASADALRRVIVAVGEIDAAIAVASFRAGTSAWTVPRFVAAGERVTFRDLRHPLIERPVPNSITLAPPNGVLVTGSNMSGKTTFVRTVGLNVVLAQTIHTCIGSEYSAPFMEVRSCIGRADDLLTGKSYYVVEVEAVIAMVQRAARPVPQLFLLDELFRGTNAVERIAAAEAVLIELLGEGVKRPHFVLASTHDAELVELLAGAYAPFHFGDSLDENGLVFDYRLREGPAHTRNAIAVLRLHGAPDRMTRRALDRAAMLDRVRALRAN
jgi:hypothetical protein